MGDARREQQRGGRPPGTKPTRVVARAIMERGAALAPSAMFGRVDSHPGPLLSFPWRPPDRITSGSLPLYWSQG